MHQPPPPPNAGLCGRCRHLRVVGNRRGSTFVMCAVAADDPRLRRYPQLPVLDCHAFEAIASGGSDPEGPRHSDEGRDA